MLKKISEGQKTTRKKKLITNEMSKTQNKKKIGRNRQDIERDMDV